MTTEEKTKKIYILEEQVLDSNPGINKESETCKGFQHIGYVKKLFSSKEEAVFYYNRINPHMRSLNVNGNYTSDVDPELNIRSRVRVFQNEILDIPDYDI